MSLDRRSFILGGTALASLAHLNGPAFAQGAVDFTGQTIEWFIPFGEGGGNDTWARFFAPFLSKYLPGEPNVIIRNVPGGGSITGTNDFAQRAKPDGLSLLGVSGSTQFPYLLDDKRVRYDYRNFTPVLASPTGGVVYIPARFGVTNAAELTKLGDQELVFANTSATSLDLVLMLAFEMLELNVRHVFGFTSRAESRLALERGEATIDYQTSSAYLANVVPLVKSGEVVPLFSLGALDANGKVVRDPTFPDLPHFLEVYEAKNGAPPPAGSMMDAFMAFFSAGFPAQKMAVLLKETPPEVVQAYHKAFEAAVADPELQAAKADILGDYPQATGAAADRLFEIATTIDPAAKAWMQDHLKTRYNADL